MAFTIDDQFIAEPRMSKHGFITILDNARSPFAPEAAAIYDYIVSVNQDPAVWLGICKHEHQYGTDPNSVIARGNTKSWGNTRSVRHPDIRATSYYDPIRRSSYIKYNSVLDSVKDCCYRIVDPDFAYRKSGANTIKEIISVWAPASDNNVPLNYALNVVQNMNNWFTTYPPEEETQGEHMTAVTENIVRQLRDRGMEVVDFRGVLPVNSRYPYRQLQGGVSGVKYIIIHWTGDAFSREFFRNVVGHDYGTSIISPDMSQPEEEMLVKWYNNYHMGKDGGTWPGIAYGIMVFPSGRIFVNFDVGTLSYHAFNANSVSYAVCMPNSNGQQPTTAQTLAINNVLDILAYHTPDIPAGHRQFFGHREATFLDSRNQTSCPGVWLPLVQHWRDTGTPTVELGKQPPGSSPTSVLHFPETGKNLVWGFKGRWEFLEQKLGREAMIWSYGYPLTDEIPDVDIDGQKRTVQVFERSVWVWHPENEGKFWEVTLVQDGKEWATQRGLL